MEVVRKIASQYFLFSFTVFAGLASLAPFLTASSLPASQPPPQKQQQQQQHILLSLRAESLSVRVMTLYPPCVSHT